MIFLFHLDEMPQIQSYASIRYLLRLRLKEPVFYYHVSTWFYRPQGCFCNQSTETEAEAGTQTVLRTFSILFGKGTTQDEPRFNNT